MARAIPGADVGESVDIDQGVVAKIATYGNYSRNKASIHYALWRATVTATVGGKPSGVPEEWIYDAMGSLASTLRHAEFDPPGTFHYALSRLQLILKAIDRTEADPVRQHQARDPRYRTLKQILLALESALARYLRAHPECVLSHEQWAGLEPKPTHDRDALGSLGEKPPFRKQRLKEEKRRSRHRGSEPPGDGDR
jgi:hypothetical protein